MSTAAIRAVFIVVALFGLALIHPAFKWSPAHSADRIVEAHDSAGNPVAVLVYERECHIWPARNPYGMPEGMRHAGAYAEIRYVKSGIASVKLCGHVDDEKHEVDHIRGMRHGQWLRAGAALCTTITEAGWNTGYKVGERICLSAVLPRGEYKE